MWMGVGVRSHLVKARLVGLGLSLLFFLPACAPRRGTTTPKQMRLDASSSPAAQDNVENESQVQRSHTLRMIAPGPHKEPNLEQWVYVTPMRILIEIPSLNQAWLFVRGSQSKDLQAQWILPARKAIVTYRVDDLRVEGMWDNWDELSQTLQSHRRDQKNGVDSKKLRNAETRFPSYRVYTLEQWRKASHQLGPPGGHHHGPGGHRHESGGHWHRHGHDHGHDHGLVRPHYHDG